MAPDLAPAAGNPALAAGSASLSDVRPEGPMQERIARLESTVASLQAEVTALRTRVSALEYGTPVSAASPGAFATIPEVDAAQVEGWLAVVGRTLVILG